MNIKLRDFIIKKRFGQNFIFDSNLLSKIVNVASNIKDKNVLEIGTGFGTLTETILKKEPKKLVSVEIDTDLISYIQEKFNSFNNFIIINNDALNIDERIFFDDNKINVIANLPYNISTNLLIRWMKNIHLFQSFVLLLQKEVVDRIIAKYNTKEYGPLSILIQALCDVEKKFDVNPSCFIPKPKVISSVISIIPKKNINIDLEKLSFLVFNLFSKRRKKIKKTIENLVSINKLNKNIFNVINLDLRPEEIDIYKYIECSSCVNV